MPKDILEQYRSGVNNAGKAIASVERATYESYKAVDKRQNRLKIRPAMRAWERMTYSHLHRVVEDGVYGTEIVLVFSFAVVVIKGKDLHPIADAIDVELCEFIQQYDSDRWERPTEAKSPFIETISIHVETREERVRATDKALSDIASTRKGASSGRP